MLFQKNRKNYQAIHIFHKIQKFDIKRKNQKSTLQQHIVGTFEASLDLEML